MNLRDSHEQNFEDNYSVYELVSEDHHDHMVCIDSGKVIEFKNDLIEQEKIAKKYGYKIVDHKLVLYVKPLDEKNKKQEKNLKMMLLIKRKITFENDPLKRMKGKKKFWKNNKIFKEKV